MGKKQISRKEFLNKTLTGVAGLGIISKYKSATSGVEARPVGKTGINVTRLCFGAPRTNEESLIKYVVEKGINFIDTGRAYGNGNNEKLVGKAVSGMRENVVIQSKIRLEYNE